MTFEKLLCIHVFLVFTNLLMAQVYPSEIRPVVQELLSRKAVYEQPTIPLFSRLDAGMRSPNVDSYVRSPEFLQLDTSVLSQLRSAAPELLRLPVTAEHQRVVLDLYRTEIFTEEYHLRTQTGPAVSDKSSMLFYRGMIVGDVNSVAVVSILQDEVRVMYSSDDGNYRMHNMQDDQYVLYKDKDVLETRSFTCEIEDRHLRIAPENPVQQRTVLTGNCVEVYFECDYKSYQDNGNSVTATEAWVAALFNEVSTLYENESIPVSISDIMVWTSTDPYAGLANASLMLDEFMDQINTNGYDGRLAHLLSTRNINSGIAYIDVLCSNSLPIAVSTGLSTNIAPFPNYSWTVLVVTHEMGHNFGSRHTHACVWNGNNTQIDDCGNEWGDEQPCYNEINPILPVDGTIMSYCHLVGVGINFSLGFGTQPGNLIRSEYQNASCNTGICSPPSCTGLTEPTHMASLVDVSANIHWAAASGASGYRVTIGTAPGSGNIVNNLDVGNVISYNPVLIFPFNKNVYVKIVPYNLAGTSTGCTEEFFTTEPGSAPSCTILTSPLNGAINVATNADLFWNHSVGNQSGYKITMGTTPGGSQILNLLDVGNVSTYHPPTLPSSSTIYVRITPYWPGGGISGCIEESFTTIDATYCTSAGQSSAGGYISSVTVGDMTKTSGAQGYSNFTSHVAHGSAGGSVPLSINVGYPNQVYPVNIRIWIDLNASGIFGSTSERVFQAGNVVGTVSGTINIPLSATPGIARMRISLRYGSYSSPCQTFAYGEVEDYTIHIHCNLVTQTTDSGAGSLPWVVGCASAGETVTFASALNGETILLEDNFVVIDKPLTIHANPGSNIWIHGLTTPKVFQINSGISITLSGLNIISGTASDGGAIYNAGNLTITDLHIQKHAGMPNSKPLMNTGTLMIEGACMVD